MAHHISCKIDSDRFDYGLGTSTIKYYVRTLRGGYFVTEQGRFDQSDIEIVLSPSNPQRFVELVWIDPYARYFRSIGCLSKRAHSKNKVIN